MSAKDTPIPWRQVSLQSVGLSGTVRTEFNESEHLYKVSIEAVVPDYGVDWKSAKARLADRLETLARELRR